MAFLKVYVGGTERTVFLGDQPVVIGRDASCDIPIPDLKISRRHCVIEPLADGAWRVRDLGSGNGTRVNGREISSHDLAREDVLEVGDAKVLFAGEAAAVVVDAAPPAAAPRAPARARTQTPKKRIPVAYWLGGGGLALAAILLLFVLKGLETKERRDPAEEGDYRAVVESRADSDRVKFGEMFLARYPRSAHAAEVQAAVAAAQDRLSRGVTPGGYDPRPELVGLRPAEAVARLEKMLTEAPEERRPAIRVALEEKREALAAARETFFAERLLEFRQQVEAGEYARARETWFFLRGEPDWEPIPPEYASRIVDANRELGNAAAAERARILEDELRYEAARDFARAKELLSQALPRFKGTGVDGSIRDRLDALERGPRGGPSLPPAQSLVRVDVGQKMAALLETFQRGDFAGAAAGLRALAEEAKKQSDPGFLELDARAGECEAAAALQAATVTALGGGDLPKGQLRKRWRVISGGADGVRVATKGEETDVAWVGMPADLRIALLEVQAAKIARGWLGLAAVAQAIGAPSDMIAALARAYEDEASRPAVDAFVAARVRKEAVPEGGYVVHEGELLLRKEFLRRQEEQQIAAFTAQLDKAYTAIRGDPAFGKLEKLRKRKDELDVARNFALELIFDEQKYFYPYRGTGREGEYQKVQQEVDRRVRAVEEIWGERTTVSVKASSELERALKQFDEAAAGLRRYLVDVDEKNEEVAFLRSYVGKKFDLATYYRTPEERELLAYTREVMEANPKVEGDISPVEREQVQITNLYRIMFGRQPVRIVDKLVKAARGHSEEMSKIGYFSHFSPTPGLKTPWDRMKREGYDYGVSENIIQGQPNPMAAHIGWCHSSGHHRNILMPSWTEMGTGAYGNLMTQNYGQAPKWSKEAGIAAPEEAMQEGHPWEDEGVPGADGPAPEDEGLDYEDGD